MFSVAGSLAIIDIGDRQMVASRDSGYMVKDLTMGYVVKCGALWVGVVARVGKDIVKKCKIPGCWLWLSRKAEVCDDENIVGGMGLGGDSPGKATNQFQVDHMCICTGFPEDSLHQGK